MHTSNHDVQALKKPAPQNSGYENVARTIRSRETHLCYVDRSLALADLLGKGRS
jgi:hypothetical protein